MIKKAQAARLSNERQKVIDEITDNLLYPRTAKEEAVALLKKDPANTQDDNIQRIIAAYAKVDARFGAGYKLFTDGKFKEAAEAIKASIRVSKEDDQTDVSFGNAAKYFLRPRR